MKSQQQIKEFATIAHLYFVDGTLTKEEVCDWMEDFGLNVVKLLKGRIEFTYLGDDEWYRTKMIVWKNGKVEVQTNI